MYTLFQRLLPIGTALLLVLTCHSPVNGQSEDSTLHTYLGALEKAEKQQKEMIAWFGAQWCSSCQTIRDEWLQELDWMGPLREGYIHAWIDVDDFDGYVLKEKFDIDQLPSAVLINRNGTARARLNKISNKQSFTQWLQQYRLNAKPNEPTDDAESEAVSKERESDVIDPYYRVQLGVFSTEERASRRAEEIELKTGLKVITKEERNDGQRVFKLLSEKFQEKKFALQARDRLNSYGIDGFVRTLKGTKNI